jgi:hypothetical protein
MRCVSRHPMLWCGFERAQQALHACCHVETLWDSVAGAKQAVVDDGGVLSKPASKLASTALVYVFVCVSPCTCLMCACSWLAPPPFGEPSCVRVLSSSQVPMCRPPDRLAGPVTLCGRSWLWAVWLPLQPRLPPSPPLVRDAGAGNVCYTHHPAHPPSACPHVPCCLHDCRNACACCACHPWLRRAGSSVSLVALVPPDAVGVHAHVPSWGCPTPLLQLRGDHHQCPVAVGMKSPVASNPRARGVAVRGMRVRRRAGCALHPTHVTVACARWWTADAVINQQC